ncbi:MAG: ABC transporter ATP-binding protein [Spirochaetes bacterium]|nr:MAG: ABC transporter ATP-binding protein [Spirochaetota bacterium]
MNDTLLNVKNLKTYFFTDEGVARAVDGMSLSVRKGETLGVIGESGCGKSVTALSIMRLIDSPPGKILEGEVIFGGEEMLKKSSSEMRKIRGKEISMIFQEPMTSLNPVYTIGNQISETVLFHQNVNKNEARKIAVEMLKLVGIPLPERRVNEYPHQLSGGMRQRAMIAMALSCKPKLLIADEPTTALDVTIQAQILDLIKRIKKEVGMAVMIITHDLGVIAEMAENVVVVYGGMAVEYADVRTIFKEPKHPYTIALYNSIPRLTDQKKRRLEVIPGTVPDPMRFPAGCRFHPRCRFAQKVCTAEIPELQEIDQNHRVRCFIYDRAKSHYFKESISKRGNTLGR